MIDMPPWTKRDFSGARIVGLIYVSSQGLYFETFVAADPLPMKGRFQKIYGGPMAPPPSTVLATRGTSAGGGGPTLTATTSWTKETTSSSAPS